MKRRSTSSRKHYSQPYFRLTTRASTAAGSGPFSVPALCAAYNWPTGAPGGGLIAIVELGGGWVASDMASFFGSVGQPVPTITDVSVDGTQNDPNASVGSPDDPDFEVALDIQVAGAAYYVATGKPATIRVYWSQDIVSAVRAATADGCDVCSISWGSDEANWGNAAAEDMEAAALAATQAGMVVFAASGDNDAGDGGQTPANVDLPSACPHVVGCGGTKKTATLESVWNHNPGVASGEGTGGGYSTIFPVQSFQVGAPLPSIAELPGVSATLTPGSGRMVPDVSANADPDTGYNVWVHGQQTVVGGTSAVAPLYAGLFASFGTKLGFVTPKLWQNQGCFNDITVGDNGAYQALVGPDPCSGIGSPIGESIRPLF